MNHRQGRQPFLIRDSIASLIRMGSLVAIATGLFAIASGGVMLYLNLSSQLDLERADRAASQQAAAIAARLSEMQAALRDVEVIDAVRNGEAGNAMTERSVRDTLQARGIVNVLEVNLLPSQVDTLALDEESGLGFAATEMAIEAIRGGRPEARILHPGSPNESLAFAQRMPGDAGILLLRLTTSVAARLLRPDETLDFVALAQRSGGDLTVLHAAGRPVNAPVREVPVDGTRLTLQWSRAVVQAPIDNRAAVIFGSCGIIVLMVGLLLRRRTRLASYLDAGAPAPAAGPIAGRGAAEAPSAFRGRRPTERTLVLDPEETDDDEPPTVVAEPDLPEWLRESGDDRQGEGRTRPPEGRRGRSD